MDFLFDTTMAGKITGLPQKNDGTGRVLSFWVQVPFQGRAVELQGCRFEE